MKTFLRYLTVWFVVVSLAICYSFRENAARVRAQALASFSYGVAPTFLLANCPGTALAGLTTFCSTGDGKQYYCLNTTTTCATSTAGWVPVGGAVAAGVQ